METLSPSEARLLSDGFALLGGDGAEVASVESREVGGVPALVITPHGTGPFPVLVWMHGGGWVVGSPTESLATGKNLAAKAQCVVVSLDYRMAPEHKAPAAYDDCVAATAWLVEHAGDIGGDPTRIAVGGDSAGGNLSALVAQALGGALCFQALIYPATDVTGDYPSRVENADGYLLTKSMMEWFEAHYLEDSGIDPSDLRVSPLLAPASTVAATAPALVITAGYDPLRDEGQAYAAHLTAAGVSVVHRHFAGQIHGFFSMPNAVPDAVVAEDLTAELLRKAFQR